MEAQSRGVRLKNDLNVINTKLLLDLFLYVIIGLIIGARLGYVIFYNLPYYFRNPWEITLPFKITGYWLLVTSYQYTGISGMSYFGGLIGIIIAALIFARKYKINFWRLADFVVPAVPAGYFFGRIGNFLNGELYGRVTQKWWGMYFPADSFNLRHPSQLYEAFFEGLVLFLVLWLLRNHSKFPGYLLVLYLAGYGLLRFAVEFFREPDSQIGLIMGVLTFGQALSLVLIIILLFISFYLPKK